jgi:Fur family ferric uptake transcriptional regulator
MTVATSLERLLVQAGYRLTRPRRAIVELVLRQEGHFRAEEVVAEVQRVAPGTGRATVYRTLELLAEVGAVERIHLQEGSHGYVRGDLNHPHHHHFICSCCGKVQEFDDGQIPDLVEALARRAGFTVEAHEIEVYGRCSDCPEHDLSCERRLT